MQSRKEHLFTFLQRAIQANNHEAIPDIFAELDKEHPEAEHQEYRRTLRVTLKKMDLDSLAGKTAYLKTLNILYNLNIEPKDKYFNEKNLMWLIGKKYQEGKDPEIGKNFQEAVFWYQRVFPLLETAEEKNMVLEILKDLTLQKEDSTTDVDSCLALIHCYAQNWAKPKIDYSEAHADFTQMTQLWILLTTFSKEINDPDLLKKINEAKENLNLQMYANVIQPRVGSEGVGYMKYMTNLCFMMSINPDLKEKIFVSEDKIIKVLQEGTLQVGRKLQKKQAGGAVQKDIHLLYSGCLRAYHLNILLHIKTNSSFENLAHSLTTLATLGQSINENHPYKHHIKQYSCAAYLLLATLAAEERKREKIKSKVNTEASFQKPFDFLKNAMDNSPGESFDRFSLPILIPLLESLLSQGFGYGDTKEAKEKEAKNKELFINCINRIQNLPDYYYQDLSAAEQLKIAKLIFDCLSLKGLNKLSPEEKKEKLNALENQALRAKKAALLTPQTEDQEKLIEEIDNFMEFLKNCMEGFHAREPKNNESLAEKEKELEEKYTPSSFQAAYAAEHLTNFIGSNINDVRFKKFSEITKAVNENNLITTKWRASLHYQLYQAAPKVYAKHSETALALYERYAEGTLENAIACLRSLSIEPVSDPLEKKINKDMVIEMALELQSLLDKKRAIPPDSNKFHELIYDQLMNLVNEQNPYAALIFMHLINLLKTWEVDSFTPKPIIDKNLVQLIQFQKIFNKHAALLQLSNEQKNKFNAAVNKHIKNLLSNSDSLNQTDREKIVTIILENRELRQTYLKDPSFSLMNQILNLITDPTRPPELAIQAHFLFRKFFPKYNFYTRELAQSTNRLSELAIAKESSSTQDQKSSSEIYLLLSLDQKDSADSIVYLKRAIQIMPLGWSFQSFLMPELLTQVKKLKAALEKNNSSDKELYYTILNRFFITADLDQLTAAEHVEVATLLISQFTEGPLKNNNLKNIDHEIKIIEAALSHVNRAIQLDNKNELDKKKTDYLAHILNGLRLQKQKEAFAEDLKPAMQLPEDEYKAADAVPLKEMIDRLMRTLDSQDHEAALHAFVSLTVYIPQLALEDQPWKLDSDPKTISKNLDKLIWFREQLREHKLLDRCNQKYLHETIQGHLDKELLASIGNSSPNSRRKPLLTNRQLRQVRTRLTNPFDKIAGLLLGAVTGAVTAISQIPYIYYIFAKDKRAKGSSWPGTLFKTATIGTLYMLFSALNSWGIIGWGMKVGFAKGIKGAITLPATFYKDPKDLSSLLVSGLPYIMDSDAQGNFKKPPQVQALVQRNTFLEEMDTVQNHSNQPIRLLAEAEILDYKKAIQSLPEEKRLQKEEALAHYQERIRCPITHEIPDNPITVVLEKNVTRTYDYSALRTQINLLQDKQQATPLKDLDMHKGYSSQVTRFVKEVRKVNRQQQQASIQKSKKRTAEPFKQFNFLGKSFSRSDKEQKEVPISSKRSGPSR